MQTKLGFYRAAYWFCQPDTLGGLEIVMVSTQNKQMAQFFASVTERMSHGDFDLPSIRDIYETMHLAASEPEGVSYAEVDIDGVPALWCIPDVDTQGSTTGSGPSAAPTRDNPPPARWPSAPIPTPCCRWAAVARGDWAEAARPGGGPFRQPQGILAVVFGVRGKTRPRSSASLRALPGGNERKRIASIPICFAVPS